MITGQKRQGDVLFHPVTALPKDAVPFTPEGGRFVFAEGEVTGHAHATDDATDADWWKVGDRVLVRPRRPVAVRHEEHAVQVLEVGRTYEVRRQIEEFMDEVRQVAD